jgi:hypothetical protein
MLKANKTICPLIKKECIEYRCKFFIHLIGNNPNTGQPIDQYDCAVAWLPILLIEGAQQTRQAGAAIESFRNEVVKQNEVLNAKLQSSEQRQIGDLSR